MNFACFNRGIFGGLFVEEQRCDERHEVTCFLKQNVIYIFHRDKVSAVRAELLQYSRSKFSIISEFKKYVATYLLGISPLNSSKKMKKDGGGCH